jgi:hypothetical protein
MGQRDKVVKGMAIGLLTNKIMYEILYEAEQNLKDPKELQWVKDNLRMVTLQRLNIVLGLLDKRKLTAEDMQNLDQATQWAQLGYEAYLKVRANKKKEKEEKQNMGQQVTPV